MGETRMIGAAGMWDKIVAEAKSAALSDPRLASFFDEFVLERVDIVDAVSYRVGKRLGADFVRDVAGLFAPQIAQDIAVVYDRDPACNRYLEPLLYFKGFHALQTYRIAHHAWCNGQRDMALLLQSLSSAAFQVDIHPAAKIGSGVFIDHATGIVIGETAVVEDDVSMLHGVTLGGTGKDCGMRHPKIRHGVLIGAGAKILGNIEVGAGAKVGAGSVVLSDVPPHTVVAGVPARIVSQLRPEIEPSHDMDQSV